MPEQVFDTEIKPDENLVGMDVVVFPSEFKGTPYVFHVQGGFGAEPDKIGTGVFGTFLIDGEQAKIHRGNIWRKATPEEVTNKKVSDAEMARIVTFFCNREQFLYSWVCRIEDAIDAGEITNIQQVKERIDKLDDAEEMNTSL